MIKYINQQNGKKHKKLSWKQKLNQKCSLNHIFSFLYLLKSTYNQNTDFTCLIQNQNSTLKVKHLTIEQAINTMRLKKQYFMMQTFSQIIRSLFILTLIGALTYRLSLTLFFLHYHSEYLLHHQTIPAVVYLLVSYTALILGLAYMYNKIYDIEKKYESMVGKLVGVCYLLLGILIVPLGYGSVLWVVGLKARVDRVFVDREKMNFGDDFGVSEDNMLKWYQISFYIQLSVFAFASIVILFHLAYLAFDKIKQIKPFY